MSSNGIVNISGITIDFKTIDGTLHVIEGLDLTIRHGEVVGVVGETGCGKTHLAAAIANYAVESGIPTLFITVPDMLDSLRFSYNNPDTTFEQRFEEIRTAPLLILDDFGTENATPWAQEK